MISPVTWARILLPADVYRWRTGLEQMTSRMWTRSLATKSSMMTSRVAVLVDEQGALSTMWLITQPIVISIRSKGIFFVISISVRFNVVLTYLPVHVSQRKLMRHRNKAIWVCLCDNKNYIVQVLVFKSQGSLLFRLGPRGEMNSSYTIVWSGVRHVPVFTARISVAHVFAEQTVAAQNRVHCDCSPEKHLNSK